MYAGCSEKYWKERSRKRGKNFKITLFTLVTLYTIVALWTIAKRRRESNQMYQKSLIRPKPSHEEKKKCEFIARDKLQNECMSLCVGERNSIPRPTMYNSCMHGCTSSFLGASSAACQENSAEELLVTNLSPAAISDCDNFKN
mmetsp:Transcript_22707/g.32038  ORF Transcript_22707/g.32038 Transcript_22707/m.32038 type:complete len:143 (+) Transcript_22707:123-551(+)